MMIPKNKYTARAVGHDLGVADSGKEFIAVEFEIQSGEHAGDRLTWRGFFTEKTAERTIESLRYCGWKGDDLTDMTGFGSTLVQIVVDHESYEGKTYARIQWVNKLGVSLKNAMDAGTRAAFAARMKGLAVSVDKSLADGPAAPAAVASSTRNDDGDPGFDDADALPF